LPTRNTLIPRPLNLNQPKKKKQQQQQAVMKSSPFSSPLTAPSKTPALSSQFSLSNSGNLDVVGDHQTSSREGETNNNGTSSLVSELSSTPHSSNLTATSARHSIIKTRLIKTKIGRWISKSLAPSLDGVKSSNPITKQHRKLLSALWTSDAQVSDIFKCLSTHHLERQSNMNQCVKGLILLLRLVQFGPAGTAQACMKHMDYVESLTAAW